MMHLKWKAHKRLVRVMLHTVTVQEYYPHPYGWCDEDGYWDDGYYDHNCEPPVAFGGGYRT